MRANSTDTGYDLVAITDGRISESGQYIEYDTGVAIQPPEGYYTEVYPRSSISKTDFVLANSIGLIDSGYRNSIKLRFKIVSPWGSDGKTFKGYAKGDKIGQLVIRKTESAEFIVVDELDTSDRGLGGFGSTDKR